MAFVPAGCIGNSKVAHGQQLRVDSKCHTALAAPVSLKIRTNGRSALKLSRQSPRMVIEVKENDVEDATADASGGTVYSCKNMTVEEFFDKSLGEWKSQRSSHNLAWAQFEAVTSEISIEPREVSDRDVVELCKQNDVSVDDVLVSIAMSWEGESDWDDEETMSGSTVMSVVKDTDSTGRLLRSMGYAEEIPAVGTWEMTSEGVFVLTTSYDAAAAEERIWFATPDLRMRVSQIRTSSGRGVVTASFSTEIRKLDLS